MAAPGGDARPPVAPRSRRRDSFPQFAARRAFETGERQLDGADASLSHVELAQRQELPAALQLQLGFADLLAHDGGPVLDRRLELHRVEVARDIEARTRPDLDV